MQSSLDSVIIRLLMKSLVYGIGSVVNFTSSGDKENLISDKTLVFSLQRFQYGLFANLATDVSLCYKKLKYIRLTDMII